MPERERDPERLLTAYRSGLGPSRAAEDRMLASLQAQIVVLPDPSVTSGGVGTSAGAGAGGGVAAAAGAKLAAVVLVASVGIATVAVAVFGPDATTSARAPVEQVELEPEQVEPHDPMADPMVDPMPEPMPEIVPAPAVASERVEPSPPTLDVPGSADAPRPRVSSRPRSARADELGPAVPLADEAKLLRNVDAALRARNLAAARTQLEVYRHTFARGSLRAQADELALLLACADELDGASTRALDHLHAHPDTRARARIEDACGLR
jgi:hypothetical protein